MQRINRYLQVLVAPSRIIGFLLYLVRLLAFV